MIRVLVVDDQALVRGRFRLILESQPDVEVVGEAADGREALAKARHLVGDHEIPQVGGFGDHVIPHPAVT